MKKNQAVFLDRDGVLNKAILRNGKPYPPAHLDELIIPDEVGPALAQLKKAGFLLIGATNQPDVARHTTLQTTVEALNGQLMRALPLDEISVCYHDDDAECDCRKPKPGLLISAAKKYDLALENCFMVGDRWRDIEAGQRAQCKTIWINRHYIEKQPKQPNFMTHSLAGAVDWILQQ